MDRVADDDAAAVDRQLAAYGAQLRRWVVRIAAACAAGLGALAVVIVATGHSDDAAISGVRAGPGAYPSVAIAPSRVALASAARAAGCRVLHPPYEGDEHVAAPVRYRANPPTSGDHFARPARDGAYVRAPAVEAGVHALEHGRVFIQFRPGATARVRGELFALYREDPHHLLLGPNTTGMAAEVAATAWNHALLCPRMNDRVLDAIRSFRDRYRDHAPEAVK